MTDKNRNSFPTLEAHPKEILSVQTRGFLEFYIERLQIFSSIGIFRIKWCEDTQQFVEDTRRWTQVLWLMFRLLLIGQMGFIGARTAWYFLLFDGPKKIDEIVILATWYMVASGSVFCIGTLWRKGSATMKTINALVQNIGLLKEIHNWSPEEDPIRNSFRLFGDYFFFACLGFYSVGISALYYSNPNHVVFLYSVLKIQSFQLSWLPFLALEILIVAFYVGMLAFYAHLFAYISYSILYGFKQLKHDVTGPASVTSAPQPIRLKQWEACFRWYRQSCLMIRSYNEALDLMMITSSSFHQLALSLTVFSIIRLSQHLTPLTYALYYFIFAQVTTYTIKAYFTLGTIPSSSKKFIEFWKLYSRTKLARAQLACCRPVSINLNGLCAFRKSQLPLVANIGVNLIILFLEL